ncbi:Demethylsterigmatocystin 6-O-methyltransferase [Grifola frondosa]|uniref:Demethylsterigmatocystin 6-O-methyltransferase n=1 Tax=Grifola frondosa TaxID=5627 RepID=A0A1C7LU77_GRIFR|nr:Demethylsterigmatocystin 6-O-methyltransferase [Grifola frondosa]
MPVRHDVAGDSLDPAVVSYGVPMLITDIRLSSILLNCSHGLQCTFEDGGVRFEGIGLTQISNAAVGDTHVAFIQEHDDADLDKDLHCQVEAAAECHKDFQISEAVRRKGKRQPFGARIFYSSDHSSSSRRFPHTPSPASVSRTLVVTPSLKSSSPHFSFKLYTPSTDEYGRVKSSTYFIPRPAPPTPFCDSFPVATKIGCDQCKAADDKKAQYIAVLVRMKKEIEELRREQKLLMQEKCEALTQEAAWMEEIQALQATIQDAKQLLLTSKPQDSYRCSLLGPRGIAQLLSIGGAPASLCLSAACSEDTDIHPLRVETFTYNIRIFIPLSSALILAIRFKHVRCQLVQDDCWNALDSSSPFFSVKMTEQSELDLLQAHLNASIDAFREELAAAALPPLSSQATEAHALDDPSFLPNPRLFEARRLAIACVGQLKNLLQLPFHKAVEQSYAANDSACIDVFVKMGSLITWQAVKPFQRAEVTESVFALNRPALDLVSGKHSRIWIEFFPKEFRVAASLQDWITDPRWKHSQSPDETAFQMANATDLGLWQWFDEHPTVRASFASAVQAFGQCHSQGVLSDYPWSTLPTQQTIIDCGGGQGAFSIALAALCPSNKFIIQDLGGVVEHAAANVETHVPGALTSGRIAVEVHDFFSPMPHRGDDYSFVFRHSCKHAFSLHPVSLYHSSSSSHDWPADQVIQILTHIAQAAGPKSRILIVENILATPSTDVEMKGANPITLDDLAFAEHYQPLTPPSYIPSDFGAASRTQKVLALYIMSILNAQERTLTQWRELIEASHLKISGVFSLRAVLSVIECRIGDAKGCTAQTFSCNNTHLAFAARSEDTDSHAVYHCTHQGLTRVVPFYTERFLRRSRSFPALSPVYDPLFSYYSLGVTYTFTPVVTMAPQSELDLLQAHLNASIDAFREELAAAALPPLSSQAPEAHVLDDPSFLPSPRLFEARRLTVACMVSLESSVRHDSISDHPLDLQGQLKNLLQLPFQKAIEQSYKEYDTACIDIFVKTGIVDYMASCQNMSAGVSTKELGQHLDLDPRKLTTILRYLSVDGWVREVTESVFALNRPALDLVSGKHSRIWIELFPKEIRVATSLQDWITHPRWKHSQSPDETAFQMVNTTNLGLWQWFDEHPAACVRLAGAVEVFGQCHIQGVLSDYPWSTLPTEQTIIDCGGGHGAFSIALATSCPLNKFIIQDRECNIEHAATNVETRVPGALASGRIAVEAHDFFSPMPHRGDDYSFVFRHVLHDWPADQVIKILTHIAQAAGPKSRILIVENILATPTMDVERKDGEELTLDELVGAEDYRPLTPPSYIPSDFGAASQMQKVLALYIMGLLNAQERTLPQWRELIEASHLKITRVFSLRAVLSVIECRVADAEE